MASRRGRPRTGNRPGRRVHRSKGVQVADDLVLERMDDIEKAVNRSSALKALRKAAKPIRDQVEMNAPVRDVSPGEDPRKSRGESKGGGVAWTLPGHLKDRVIVRTIRKSKSPIPAVNVGPSTKAFYGMFYEFGTHRQPARPFVRPAFDQRKGEAVRILRTELWKIIREGG